MWHPYHPPYETHALKYQVDGFNAELEARPDDAELHWSIAVWLYYRDEYIWADRNLRFALAVSPDHIATNLALGVMRAVCPDQSFRNGAEAVELTGKAYSQAELNGDTKSEWVLRRHLQSIAAAHAENHNWVEAVRYQNQAISVTSTRSHVAGLTNVLLEYLQERPIRRKRLLL